MSLSTNVAANLKRARLRRNLSQQALARLAGISVSYVSMLEREVRTPPLDMLEQLATALQVRPSDLLRAA